MAGRHGLRRKLPVLVGAAVLVLFTAAVVLVVRGFLEGAGKPERPRVQQISIVKPPPPREPPKPPEPPKVEPEKPREEVKLDQQPDKTDADAPPPGEQLGVDAEGGAGGDAFGLAARKGGRDITTLGGGGGDREAWYGRLISRHFETSLRRVKRLQGSAYQLVVNVWFDGAGNVVRAQVARGSGNGETDQIVREEILALPPLREALPEDLPQPVRVRVASRA
jgi:protein TonB